MTSERFALCSYIRITVSHKSGTHLLSSFKQNAPMNCTILLCANKFDLPAEFRAVSKEEYLGFAMDHNMDLIECSAASGQNVNDIFVTLGRSILATNRSNLAEVHIDPNEADKGSIILREFAASKKKKPKDSCCSIS